MKCFIVPSCRYFLKKPSSLASSLNYAKNLRSQSKKEFMLSISIVGVQITIPYFSWTKIPNSGQYSTSDIANLMPPELHVWSPEKADSDWHIKLSWSKIHLASITLEYTGIKLGFRALSDYKLAIWCLPIDGFVF